MVIAVGLRVADHLIPRCCYPEIFHVEPRMAEYPQSGRWVWRSEFQDQNRKRRELAVAWLRAQWLPVQTAAKSLQRIPAPGLQSKTWAVKLC